MKNITRKTLDEFIIERQEDFRYSTGELSRLLNSILLAARVVSYKVNKAGLVDILGAAGNTNIQGEEQKKLDIITNDIMLAATSKGGCVAGLASEEMEDIYPLPEGLLAEALSLHR